MRPLAPLPDCEGPKLDPFTQDITAHDFEFLDIPWYENAHGVIAKVKIDGRVYCLKLFFAAEHTRRLDLFPEDCPRDPSPELQKLISDHSDPFHCECRAFGRLKEVGREDVAVRVYGYISLPLTKDILAKMHQALKGHVGWERSDLVDGSWTVSTKDPRDVLRRPDGPDDGSWCVMGVLKDWIGPVDGGVSPTRYEEGLVELRQPSMFRRMLANLKALHRHGIVVCDVRADQWVEGTLVDLSGAMTTPHLSGPGGAAGRPSWTLASVAAWDLLCFQLDFIETWNEMDWSYYTASGITPPRRKCRLRAYGVPDRIRREREEWLRQYMGRKDPAQPVDAASAASPPRQIRDCLRPRPKQFGPFLPLPSQSGYSDLDLVELPPYDPARFDWRAAAAAAGGPKKPPPRKAALSRGVRGRGKKMHKRRADSQS